VTCPVWGAPGSSLRVCSLKSCASTAILSNSSAWVPISTIRAARPLHAYYGLPSNWHRLGTFYDEVCRLWYRVLSRRSQRWLAWSRFKQLLERFPLPRARIHARPDGGRLLNRNLRKSRVREIRTLGSVRAKEPLQVNGVFGQFLGNHKTIGNLAGKTRIPK
jgi:hypothetical protein